MQKKKNIKSKLIDLITILLCIAASAFSGRAFWQEYTRTLTKLNETPAGTIIYKKKTAQRKFIDRVVWDSLKQKSAVYNADTIRTINASQAVILFKDELTHIAMNANTIIQIFYNDKEGARIDFFGGNLDVNSGYEGITIVSGSSEIFVAGQANLSKKDEGFSISVMEGEALLDGEKIETGELLILDEYGEKSGSPAIAVTAFGSSARIISAPGTATPVDFTWNTYNFNSDSFVIIETALDPSFDYITQAIEVTDGTSARLYIDNSVIDNSTGVEYFWRAYPASSASRTPQNPMYPSGTLEIISYSEVSLVLPENSATINAAGISTAGDPAHTAGAVVPLSWTGTHGAAAYNLEISANADMNSPAVARRIEGTRVTQTGLGAGLWYWRVTPVLQSRVLGSLPSSEVRSFEIKGFESTAEILGRLLTEESGDNNITPVATAPAAERTPAQRTAREPTPEELARPFIERGIRFRDRGDFDSAIREFTEAIRINPENAEVYGQRGYTFLDRGRRNSNNKSDLDNAMEDLNWAIQLNPNNGWYYNERGHTYLSKGEYDRAISDFNEAIRIDQNQVWAFIGRGNSYSAKGDHDRAIADHNQAIRIDPNAAHFYIHRGNAYKNAGNLNRAFEDYETAIKLNPNDYWAYDCLVSTGSIKDRAISIITDVIRSNPNLETAYFQRGKAYLYNGLYFRHSINDRDRANANFDRAIEDFNRAISLNRNNSWYYQERGSAYREKGDYDLAISDYNEALRRNPNDAGSHTGLGNVYAEKGEYDLALAEFNTAVKLYPGGGWIYHNRGWFYYNYLKEYDLALADFNEGLRHDPNQADVYSGIGHIYYYDKVDYDRAIEAFENAVRLVPDNERYKNELEMARRRER